VTKKEKIRGPEFEKLGGGGKKKNTRKIKKKKERSGNSKKEERMDFSGSTKETRAISRG